MIHAENSRSAATSSRASRCAASWTTRGQGFVTGEYHGRVVDANEHVDRANGERAEAQLKREREEYARKLADIRPVIAAAIRARVNDRSMPSKYRREGALIVADWLEGKS